MWQRAMRSRDVWLELAKAADIDAAPPRRDGCRAQAGSSLCPRGFCTNGDGWRLRIAVACGAGQASARPSTPRHFEGALWSPHEIRVESRDAIPHLAAWLAKASGVEFRRGTVVRGIQPPLIETSRGPIKADKFVVCPGDDLVSLFPERIASFNVTRCKLHMMRLADPGFRLGTTVMSDLSLARYPGFAALPQAAALRRRLEAEEKRALDNGVHLIAVQSADGSLVVGDSHHYAPTAGSI